MSDLLPHDVIAFRVVVVHPDKIGGDPRGVVGVGLAVGHSVELEEVVFLTRLDGAEKQLVLLLVIARRPIDHDAVFRDVGEAHAIAICLDATIARAVDSAGVGIDAGQETALRVTRNNVRVDARKELVLDRLDGLDAVDGLAVNVVALAADGVFHAGLGHQVALVGRVDEHLGGVLVPVRGPHRRHAGTVLRDVSQDLAEPRLDTRFAQHGGERE